jgi:hypothetical protein
MEFFLPDITHYIVAISGQWEAALSPTGINLGILFI